MTEPSMYGDRAWIYDRIYHWKDYAAEAERLHAYLQAEGVEDGARVAEAACGTGNYVAQLARWYGMEGFDLHEGMLAEARRKIADVPFSVADMRTWSPTAPVDVVLCLFSSIGYLLTLDDIAAAAQVFHDGLLPGGVCVIEPWFTPDRIDPTHVALTTYDSPELKIARGCAHTIEGDISRLDFHWLVCTAGNVDRFSEVHRMRISTREELVAAFSGAGFDVRIDEEGLTGRSLLVGRRQR